MTFSATPTGIAPLFYFRMNALLKQAHPLNRTWIRTCVYLALYSIGCAIAPIFVIIAMNYNDQESIKNQVFKKFQIVMEDFWTQQVFAFDADNNPWITYFFASGTVEIIITVFVLFGCTYTINYTLNDQARSLSTHTKINHRAIFKSLVCLVSSINFADISIFRRSSLLFFGA